MKRIAPALVLVAACSSPSVPDAGTTDGSAGAARVFATTNTDEYSSGSLASVALAALTPATDLGPLEQPADTVLGWHYNRLVLMESGVGVDNVTLLDVSSTTPALVTQVAASTPDDPMGNADARDYLAIDAHRGYVARLSRTRLGIVDWSTNSLTASTVDLAAFQASATRPWPVALALVNGAVWVMLERLGADLEMPTEHGVVVRIDPSTDTLIDALPIDLGWGDPLGHFAPSVDGATVYVACVGSYQHVGNGAVVAIDTTTLVATDVVTETTLGANVDSVVVLDADRLLLRLSPEITGTAAQSSVSLVQWSLSRRVATPWLTVPGWSLTEPVVASDGRVYVGDRGDEATARPSGIRVFDAADGHEVTTAPIAVGFLPYDLAPSPR